MQKAGEDMLQKFTAKNFRCFRDFTIGQLERVNLIAGKNNTGKTALLEALFLFSGPNNPLLPHQLSNYRGIPQVDAEAEELWGWLFFGKNIDSTVELIGQMTQAETRTLKICIPKRMQAPFSSRSPVSGTTTTTTAPPVPQGPLSTAGVPREMVLDYADSTGQTGSSRASVVPFGGQVQIANLISTFPTNFLYTHSRSPQEDAARFSKLAEVGRQEEVAAPARILEPRLKHLAVLVSSGLPIIHGELEGERRMVPVPYMGEGMVRLLSILLAIANAPNGMVLLDEIENGLHYSVLRNVWRAIGDAARRANVQVFATTHSWECIQAAHHAFKEWGPYEFRYYRLDRHGEDISVKTLDERMLDTVEKTDLEVR